MEQHGPRLRQALEIDGLEVIAATEATSPFLISKRSQPTVNAVVGLAFLTTYYTPSAPESGCPSHAGTGGDGALAVVSYLKSLSVRPLIR